MFHPVWFELGYLSIYSTLNKITINPKLYSVGVPIRFPWKRRNFVERTINKKSHDLLVQFVNNRYSWFWELSKSLVPINHELYSRSCDFLYKFPCDRWTNFRDVSLLGPKHTYTASAQQMLEVCNKALNEVSTSNQWLFLFTLLCRQRVRAISAVSDRRCENQRSLLTSNGRKFNSSWMTTRLP